MNCNMDGSRLSTEQLLVIARNHACLTEKQILGILGEHNTAIIHSALLMATRQARFSMFGQGLLTLDTRTKANSPWSFPEEESA